MLTVNGGLYEYEFNLWPTEGRWERPIYDVFRLLPRVAMDLDEAGFRDVRDALERSGFSLRDATRVPYKEPESVR